jgi:hypothetical protein
MAITHIPVETPIPNSNAVPVLTPVSADANGELLDFNYITGVTAALGNVGRLSMRNAGPNTVFYMFNATMSIFPTAAVAAGSVAGNVYTPGVAQLLVNEALNWENVNIGSVGFICAAGQTATVETQVLKGSGGNGGIGG